MNTIDLSITGRSRGARPGGGRGVAVLSASIAAFAACLAPAAAQPGAPALRITIDGDLSDWPDDDYAVADGQYVYLRLDNPDAFTLQAGPQSMLLALDLDGDAATGRVITPEIAGTIATEPLGADLELIFSRPDADEPGGVDAGVHAHVNAPSGERIPIAHADVEFLFAPTFAAHAFEMRLSRRFRGEAGEIVPALTTGSVAARFIRRRHDGEAVWSSPDRRTALPRIDPEPALADVEIPEAPEGALRVMTYNVLWGAPQATPAPFARIFQALDPDIILLQEWDKRDRDAPRMFASATESWFNEHVPVEGGWRALIGPRRGMAIVSRFPVEAFGNNDLSIEIDDGGRARLSGFVRYVAGRVHTPFGYAAIATAHLRCCGSNGSEEDRERIAEAVAINGALRHALDTSPAAVRMIAGDLNLVGSDTPLAAMIAGLDTDGFDLEPVETPVLGDAAVYTWRDDGLPFTPGRLDWALVGDASARVVNAFALDTERLTVDALRTAGLERSDSRASDHLPVIVDLVTK